MNNLPAVKNFETFHFGDPMYCSRSSLQTVAKSPFVAKRYNLAITDAENKTSHSMTSKGDAISTLSTFLQPQVYYVKTKPVSLKDDYKYVSSLERDLAKGNDEVIYAIAASLFREYGPNSKIVMDLFEKLSPRYPQAKNDLSMIIINDTESPVEGVARALALLDEAVKDNCVDAIMNMAYLKETGKFVDLNLEEAFDLYERAKELGHCDADNALLRLKLKQLGNHVIIKIHVVYSKVENRA